VLVDLYAGLTEALERTVSELDQRDDDPAAFPGHDELTEAIIARDPVAARAAADSYLDAASALAERDV
jgi:DNA-binding FadR family transcriptional regulator